MAKFYGMIGYAVQVESTTNPGVWEETIVERPYTGDVLQKVGRWENEEKVNNDFTIQNRFSVVADLYAYGNLQYVRYITYMNVRWKIERMEVNRPRIIFSIGGVWNGPTPNFTSNSD